MDPGREMSLPRRQQPIMEVSSLTKSWSRIKPEFIISRIQVSSKFSMNGAPCQLPRVQEQYNHGGPSMAVREKALRHLPGAHPGRESSASSALAPAGDCSAGAGFAGRTELAVLDR